MPPPLLAPASQLLQDLQASVPIQPKQVPDESMRKKNAIYVFTGKGLELGLRLAPQTEASIYAAESLKDLPLSPGSEGVVFFSSLKELMASTFSRRQGHIFIGAAGIAVRAVAPHLTSKTRDPAVVVIDQQARHVVSLLSGHAGGANQLALQIAALCGARPVVSTATDLEGLPAIDLLAAEHGMGIANFGMVKKISAALLRGEKPLFWAPEPSLAALRPSLGDCFETKPLHRGEDEYDALTEAAKSAGRLAVIVSEYSLPSILLESCLLLHPRSLCAGVGCKKGAAAEAIVALIQSLFAERRLSLDSLACLASIEAKADEPGLLQAAATLGVPLSFFDKAALALYPAQTPSPKAFEVFGVAGVCEPAALAAAEKLSGAPGELLSPKRKGEAVTLALARMRSP